MAATLGVIVASMVPRFFRKVGDHPAVVSAATGFVTFGAGDIVVQAAAQRNMPSNM